MLLINNNQLNRAAFDDMATMKPTDGNMQVMHVNNALLTPGLMLQCRNSRFLSKKGRPVYNLLQNPREGMKIRSLLETTNYQRHCMPRRWLGWDNDLGQVTHGACQQHKRQV